jgi:hypothetical protein
VNMVSHYYSRFLARNWEHAPGQLRTFSFETGRIHRRSAKTSFTSPASFPDDVEALLSSEVESPLGQYIARCRSAEGHVTPKDITEREDRALVLAIFMQSERTAHAQGSGDVSWFASLLTDAAKCAQFVRGAREIGEIVGTNLHQDRLFLCSTAIVALPLVGLHGWLLPLTPTAFAAFIPKESSIQALDTLLERPGVMTFLSAGIQGDEVVLPPSWSGIDDATCIKRTREARDMARELNQIVFDGNDQTKYPK